MHFPDSPQGHEAAPLHEPAWSQILRAKAEQGVDDYTAERMLSDELRTHGQLLMPQGWVLTEYDSSERPESELSVDDFLEYFARRLVPAASFSGRGYFHLHDMGHAIGYEGMLECPELAVLMAEGAKKSLRLSMRSERVGFADALDRTSGIVRTYGQNGPYPQGVVPRLKHYLTTLVSMGFGLPADFALESHRFTREQRDAVYQHFFGY